MFTIEFVGGTQTRLIARLRGVAPRLNAILMTGVNRVLLMMQGKIVAKLTNDVLHVRTGILRGSVRVNPATQTAAQIAGSVLAGGGPAFYGAINELGAPKSWEIEPVRKRALSFVVDGRFRALARVSHPALPARPFMRPTAEESRAEISAALQRLVDEELQK